MSLGVAHEVHMLPLTEIGVLAKIVKELFDVAKGALTEGQPRPQDKIAELQRRMAGIAAQLKHTIHLAKMLPPWQRRHGEFDLFIDLNKIRDDAVVQLNTRLKELIHDSIHDSFSSAFFTTDFGDLPGVKGAIEAFRLTLRELEDKLNHVPTGNADAWRMSWPEIKYIMSKLGQEAEKVSKQTEKVLAGLVDELQTAANVTSP